MLKDITIGQYYPGRSVLHNCDPRLKLVATIAYIVVLFVAANPLGIALSLLLLAALYRVAKIPGKNLGLSVPQVTQIFLKLRQMGLDIPTDFYTIPYAVKTIKKALAAKQNKGVE